MSQRFAKKTVIVTGASSGIGKVTAAMFAAQGANVVLFARRKEALEAVAAEIRAAGGSALLSAGDVCSVEDCKRLFREAFEAFGSIDILINNAGAGDFHITTDLCTDEFWEKNIAVNQTAVFHLCREALAYMKPQGSGVIVNLSAIAGVYGNAGVSYSAAKAAVIAITKNIALQFAGKGIRCNAVCPGPTLVPRMSGSEDHLYNKDFQTITERHMDMTIPFSKAEDQANLILFLASPESCAINGQAIVSDGGMCL